MSLAQILEQTLKDHYKPQHLEIVNESHMHSSGLGAESHFKVLMVSEAFQDLSKVARQRHVFATLLDPMKSIHALSLRLLTPQEWNMSTTEFKSPVCHSKK